MSDTNRMEPTHIRLQSALETMQSAGIKIVTKHGLDSDRMSFILEIPTPYVWPSLSRILAQYHLPAFQSNRNPCIIHVPNHERFVDLAYGHPWSPEPNSLFDTPQAKLLNQIGMDPEAARHLYWHRISSLNMDHPELRRAMEREGLVYFGWHDSECRLPPLEVDHVFGEYAGDPDDVDRIRKVVKYHQRENPN